MYGVLCIKFETRTEPEDQGVMCGVLCIKNRESGQNPRKTGKTRENPAFRTGPSPATTCPVGAWSAMPGWLPGIGGSLHELSCSLGPAVPIGLPHRPV